MSLKRKLSAFLLLPAVAAAFAAPQLAHANQLPANAVESCELSAGTLTWGVKESFRSYISGSIAHGSWDTADGASYETPNFKFANGAGSATSTETEINFTGTIHFTGHNGLLDMTMANPSLVIKDANTAALKLDMRSNDLDGNVAVDEKQVELAAIDLTGAVTHDANSITITGAPTSLSAIGVKAFGDFYEEGAELDPISFTVTSAAGCAGVAFGEAPQAAQASTETATDSSAEAAKPADSAQMTADTSQANTGSALPWVIGIGSLAAILAGVAVFLARRKKTPEV